MGALLLALILAWQTPFPVIAQDAACGSYAVAVAPLTTGNPLTDNTVQLYDSDGQLASVSTDQPGNVTPSPRPGVALLRSLGGIYSLLDVATGQVTPVQVPEDEQGAISWNLPTYRNATVSDFMIFAGGPNAVWLVDLRSGDAVDLLDRLPDGKFIDSASIAPGGKWAQFFSKDAGYLISLETPGDPIQLSPDPTLPFPGFSADGSQLIYATRASDGIMIWSRDLATGNATVIGETPTATHLDATSNENVLLIDGQSLLMLRDSGTAPEVIFTWEGATIGIIGDTSGRYLVIGDDRDEAGTVWTWVDTATGNETELSDLTEMRPLRSSGRQDALTFLPTLIQGPGTPGAPYRTLDLTTGQVVTPLTQDSTEVWIFTSGGDNAGRYTLINAVSPGAGRMWLIDAQAGTATNIGASTGNIAARVSPDGCHLAVATYDTVGEGRTSAVTVTSLIDGSSIASVPDALLIGWTETVAAN